MPGALVSKISLAELKVSQSISKVAKYINVNKENW